MILSRESMQALEARTIARGIAADVLMETAGAKLARCITQFHLRPGLLVCYTGKGHNAGDAFVAARHLSAAGWMVIETEQKDALNIEVKFQTADTIVEFKANLLFGIISTAVESYSASGTSTGNSIDDDDDSPSNSTGNSTSNTTGNSTDNSIDDDDDDDSGSGSGHGGGDDDSDSDDD